MAMLNRGAMTQNEINNYIASGAPNDFGEKLPFSLEQLSAVPQKFLNKYAEHGGNLSGFPLKRIKKIPQESIKKYTVRNTDLSLFSNKQIKRISQETVNLVYAKGGHFDPILLVRFPSLEQKTKQVPQKIINARVAILTTLEGLNKRQIKRLRQKIVNQFIAKGGEPSTDYPKYKTLLGLTNRQIKRAPQEVANEYIINGGDDYYLTPLHRSRITQEVVNRRAINGWDMQGVSSDQTSAVPQNIVNSLAADGTDIRAFSYDQKKSIPKEIKDIYLSKGGSILYGEEVDADLPQEIVNLRIARGRTEDFFTEEQWQNCPSEIKEISQTAKKALDLFASDEMDLHDLPLDVFVCAKAKESLLKIAAWKLKNQFDDACTGKDLVNEIPQLKVSFDDKLKKFEDKVTEFQIESVKKLSTKKAKIEEKIEEKKQEEDLATEGKRKRSIRRKETSVNERKLS